MGATAYATLTSYRELNEAFDLALMEAGHRLLPLVSDHIQGRETVASPALRSIDRSHDEYLSYQVQDAAGQLLFRAPDAPSMPYVQTLAPGFKTIGKYRLFTDTDAATGMTITVAETTHGRWEAVTGSIWAMLWPLVVLIPLNIVLVWGTVRAAMQPVTEFSDAIASRGGRNLAPLDTSGQPLELQPIASAVARLLERLRAALDAERAFAANSAHELRTPIAGALAQTQRLIAELVSPTDRRRARDVETTLKRVAVLAEKLLQLSRADAGIALGERPVDVIPVLDLVVGEFRKHPQEEGRIRYVRPEGIKQFSRVDMDAFAIVVRNLIDNALNHGPRDGPVEAIVEEGGVIRIINEGPVVAPEVLAGLKLRFARGQTRHSGSGLGLAIAETIVNQIEGRLELFSPPPGRVTGFEARLTLKVVDIV